MRMCKCGKANQPTRKYCIRCGESLIGQEKKEKPVAPKPAPEPAPVETPPPVESSYQPVGAPDKMSPTTEDQWVRPSEVDSGRVRTAERYSEKTELEKAQEAFEKAEGEDIDGRMLRASEIRELMEESPPETIAEETPELEIPTAPVSEPPISTPEAAPIPTPRPPIKPHEETTPSQIPPGDSATTEVPETAPTPAATPPPAPPPKPDVVEKTIETGAASPSVQPIVTDSDIDKRIQQVDADLAEFNIKLHELQAELEEITTKNEGNMKWASTVAEQKRIQMEEAEELLRRAKEEFNNATKDLRDAEKRMKKEVGDAEKRVSDLHKRIENAQKYREKRLKEIEKEKAKEAEN